MSAAAKLKTLDGEAEAIALCLRNPVIPNIYDAEARNALDRIRNVLPQIVAVVETAERASRNGARMPASDPPIVPDEMDDLRAALAALDEQLQ